MMIYSGRMDVEMKEKSEIGKYLESVNVSMAEYARAEGIPLRTVQNWCYGVRKPAPYLERWVLQSIESYAFLKGTHPELEKEKEYMSGFNAAYELAHNK